MLNHPTIDQLHQLGLAGMARALTELEANPQSAELSHAEWLGLLLDREATERYERRLRARLRFARLRHQAVVEDVDYRAARGLDRTLFQASIGTAGRLRSEQVADINRNARPTSSESARMASSRANAPATAALRIHFTSAP